MESETLASEEHGKVILGEKRSNYRQKWKPFRRRTLSVAVQPPQDEVSTLEGNGLLLNLTAHLVEFYKHLEERRGNAEPRVFDGWTFQAVDFSPLSVDEWNTYNFSGALFLGCTFPVPEIEVQRQGGEVWRQPDEYPFLTFRSSLYTQAELRAMDEDTYQHYLANKDFRTKISQAIHDHSLTDALGDYLAGKVVVGIMGGHKLLRASTEYRQVVLLARNLARQGFLICTGGGPGAMEAANLGGYLFDRTDEEVEQALALIASGGQVQPEYTDMAPPAAVLNAFGDPKPAAPSLGIPTYRYGHEPSNYFSSHVAKFFDNAIREDGLLQVSNGGLIFIRGAAGTRQEIFQAACHNHYNLPKNTTPMVFYGNDFWGANGVYNLFYQFAGPEYYGRYALLSDSEDEIVNHLLKHAADKGFVLQPCTGR